MRIALVSGGLLPVPPVGWGAVENLIWNYKEQLEALGHLVDVYNTPWFNETVVRLHERQYDFIHLNADLLCGDLNRHLERPFCVTSHYGGFARFVEQQDDAEYELLFRDTLRAPGNVVFSEPIQRLYQQRGYTGFLEVLPNPVEARRFRLEQQGNGRAICLGRVQPRKRQAQLAALVRGRIQLDIIGPHDPAEEPDFIEIVESNESVRYLGSWDRETVYEHLTEYSCLVLLSRSEGDPLVVKEALAAGLSVVVNEASSGGLATREFITVLPESADQDAVCDTVEAAIAANHGLRREIRDFALQQFDYSVIVPRYLELAERFRSEFPFGRKA